MIIQIDSREKPRAIERIVQEFDRRGIAHPVSKLLVGDYMNYDNPRVIVDRKQNLGECISDLTQQHRRFRDELLRAQEYGIQLIILTEHGADVKCIEDVERWVNPRIWRYCREHGITTGAGMQEAVAEYVERGGQKPPQSGAWLAKTMRTVSRRYGVQWEFCSKTQTGARIIDLLGG